MATGATTSEEQVGSVRGIPLNPRFTGEIFAPTEPLIPELAEVAAPKAKVPVAGSYAIDRFVLPNDIEIPPACMIGEEDYFHFNLESTPGEVSSKVKPSAAHDPVCVTKNIPKELLESEGNKPYVFTPLPVPEEVKIGAGKDESNANVCANANVDDKADFNQKLDADVTKRLADMKLNPGNAAAIAEVKQLQQLAKEQQQVKTAVQEAAAVGKAAVRRVTPTSRASMSKSPSRPLGRGGQIGIQIQGQGQQPSKGTGTGGSGGSTPTRPRMRSTSGGRRHATPPVPNPKPAKKADK